MSSLDRLIKTQEENTLREMKKWKERYPKCLSVYIASGHTGDLLYIDGVAYVLINKFLAQKLDEELIINLQDDPLF